MATLSVNKTHKWDKGKYNKLSFKWSGAAGTGSCSVKLGGVVAVPYTVPQGGIEVEKQGGSLTNNTSKTIEYALSS